MAEAVKVTLIMCAVAFAFWLGLAILPKGGAWIALYAVLYILANSWIVGAYAGGARAANHLVKTMALFWCGLFLVGGLAYLASS
jgi:hypothetical protein